MRLNHGILAYGQVLVFELWGPFGGLLKSFNEFFSMRLPALGQARSPCNVDGRHADGSPYEVWGREMLVWVLPFAALVMVEVSRSDEERRN